MKYKLIAFDLDGTFLDKDKNIPPRNLAAIKKAAEAGLYIVPATGRIMGGMPQTIRDLPFIRYCITVNGANVYDRQEEKDIFSVQIEPALAVRVYEYLDRFEGMYDCYKDNWGFISRSMYEAADKYVPDPGILLLIKKLRTPVDDLKKYLSEKNEPIQKLQMFFKDPDERLMVIDELPKLFPQLVVSSSIKMNIEINNIEADKGKGLAALCRHLGIEREEVIAFGDGTNDTSMIKYAGLGVAMGNASPEVKAAADRITETNENAGVADVLEEILANM